jgi:hypothetical protein
LYEKYKKIDQNEPLGTVFALSLSLSLSNTHRHLIFLFSKFVLLSDTPPLFRGEKAGGYLYA